MLGDKLKKSLVSCLCIIGLLSFEGAALAVEPQSSIPQNGVPMPSGPTAGGERYASAADKPKDCTSETSTNNPDGNTNPCNAEDCKGDDCQASTATQGLVFIILVILICAAFF